MTFKNIFTEEVTQELIDRIENLSPDTRPEWGKMDVSQMLAHACVMYELVYEDKHKRPPAIARFFARLLIKKSVCGPKPYRRNSPTAPFFKIVDEKEFELEKERLINYLRKTQKLGADHFDNKEYFSFGILTLDEWNTLFYKHLDHHLQQFGV